MAKKKKEAPKREFEEIITTIDEKTYRYEISGKGEERILLLPGGGMEPGLYSRIATELSKDYTVINLARIGRAKMPPRPDELTLDYETEYFMPLLKALNIDYIVGHSSGAVLAVTIAWQLPVKGMIIYEPPVCDKFDWLEPFRKLRDTGHYVRAIRYAMKGMSASPFDKLPRIITLPIFQVIYNKYPDYVRTFENCILSEMAGLNPVYERIKGGEKITTPALVCMGDKTSKMLQVTTKDYFDACENGQFKVYHKYSHINPLMDPVPFCTDIRAFIAGLKGETPVERTETATETVETAENTETAQA